MFIQMSEMSNLFSSTNTHKTLESVDRYRRAKRAGALAVAEVKSATCEEFGEAMGREFGWPR